MQYLLHGAIYVTDIQLVTGCSVGLQVMIRGSAPEATSQFVMLALNQVLLEWKHGSVTSHRWRRMYFSYFHLKVIL